MILFLLGLVFGSFYNVVGLRIPKKKSLLRPRSHCGKCETKLRMFDLIPIASFLILKGQCRYCGIKISFIYPVVELSTAVLFMVAPMFAETTGELVMSLMLVSLLMIIFVTDISYMLIPDKILFFFGTLFVSLRIFMPLDPWWNMWIGAAVGFLFPFLIAVLSKGSMGEGDIKLFTVLGLVFGWQGVLLTLFFSSFFGALLGGIGLVFGKVKRKTKVPFAPFIVLGALTYHFYGFVLWNSYLQLLY